MKAHQVTLPDEFAAFVDRVLLRKSGTTSIHSSSTRWRRFRTNSKPTPR